MTKNRLLTPMAHRFLLTALLLIALAVPGETGAHTPIKIVYYSGNPEIRTSRDQGGLSSLAGLLKRFRSQGEHVIFLHGGRALAPSTLSSFDRGTHMVDLLNRLHPDAFGVGKSEFAYGEDELTLRSREASFPFLSANLFDPLTGGQPEGIKAFLITGSNGFDLGIFSLTSPEVLENYLPDRITLLDFEQTIRRMAAAMKSEGADLTVLMCDYLTPLFRELVNEQVLDIILVSDKEKTIWKSESSILAVHDRSDTALVIDVHLDRSKNGISRDYSVEAVQLGEIEQDPDIRHVTQTFFSKLERFLSVPIGTTKTRIDTRREMVRSAENGFGNLIADSLCSFFKADIAIMNGGGIRGDCIYPPGTVITRGDMLREIPFRNHAVNLKITGSQLLAALENGFSRIEDRKGRFPHVSGMTVRYNPDAPPFNRVRSVIIGDKVLEPAKTYTLATVNFLASGGDGYTVFKNCSRFDKYGSSRLLWEYVRDYIADAEIIAPAVEGRLIRVSD